MADGERFFTRALGAMERGESLRDLRPFRALAAKAMGSRARRHPDETEDLAQDLLKGLLLMRRVRSRSWRQLLACDEPTLKRWLLQRLRWAYWDRSGRDPELRPLDELSPAEEPVDVGVEKRVRRGIDGHRLAEQALEKLTERERRVMELRGEGRSVEETARLLGTGRSTVYEVQKSVGEKVDGRRRTSRGTRREALRQMVAAIANKKGGRR
jgi:DNA-binding CsgD family transcriptional regulator